MNNEQLVNDIVNSLVSKIADTVVARVEERFNTIIDEKLKGYGKLPGDLLESDEFREAVMDAVDRDSIVDDAAAQAEDTIRGELDIEDAVRDVIRNLNFVVNVE